MGELSTIDARMQAALARLTDNEKECLRRRLQQQTAKEMALDLGVSPHAVEKRLKMARTKLGLSSSLEAARLLTSSERYQQIGPHAADLDASGSTRNKWLTRPLTLGALIVTLIAAAAIVLALQSGEVAPAPGSDPPAVEMVEGTPEEIRAFVEESFNDMDKDDSGFIERGEVPPNAVQFTDAVWEGEGLPPPEWIARQKLRPLPVEPVMAQAAYVARRDANEDGKVSFEEYGPDFEEAASRFGVPKQWRDERRSRG